MSETTQIFRDSEGKAAEAALDHTARALWCYISEKISAQPGQRYTVTLPLAAEPGDPVAREFLGCIAAHARGDQKFWERGAAGVTISLQSKRTAVDLSIAGPPADAVARPAPGFLQRHVGFRA